MSRLRSIFLPVLWFFVTSTAMAANPPALSDEQPRLRALLEQAWMAESGEGQFPDVTMAELLYCHAAISGSAEGYYRLGSLLAASDKSAEAQARAQGYFSVAAQQGHKEAVTRLRATQQTMPAAEDCAAYESVFGIGHFQMARYLSQLSSGKQAIAGLIRRNADRQGVPQNLALAIAFAESNLDSQAVSPKNAQGVMQLIPDTQRRFGVRDPFDPRQNIDGGVRYVRWLLDYFDGNVVHAIAAYNAGEGTVRRYGGVPPYAETQAYVRRVLFYSGMGRQPAAARSY